VKLVEMEFREIEKKKKDGEKVKSKT